jgi:hypothetical protein
MEKKIERNKLIELFQWAIKQPKNRLYKLTDSDCIVSAYYNEKCGCGERHFIDLTESLRHRISNSNGELCYSFTEQDENIYREVLYHLDFFTIGYTTGDFLDALKAIKVIDIITD